MRISCSVRSKAVQFQIIELMANVVQARHLLVEKSNGELTANVPPIGVFPRSLRTNVGDVEFVVEDERHDSHGSSRHLLLQLLQALLHLLEARLKRKKNESAFRNQVHKQEYERKSS